MPESRKSTLVGKGDLPGDSLKTNFAYFKLSLFANTGIRNDQPIRTRIDTHTPSLRWKLKEVISEALGENGQINSVSHSRGGKGSTTAYAKLCKTSLYNFGFHDIGYDKDKITEKQSCIVHMQLLLFANCLNHDYLG